MKHFFYLLSFCLLLLSAGCDEDEGNIPIGTNIIEYLSTDGLIVTPFSPNGFGAPLLSNTYQDGEGTITFSGAVTAIGYQAFLNCSTLRVIIIPNRVRAINAEAFSGCDNLLEVAITGRLTEVGDSAFAYCDNLSTFFSPLATDDGRCLIMRGSLEAFAPAGITTYSIPPIVTEIGGGAFEGCEALTSISIPATVTEIDERAFAYCLLLASIDIPAGISEVSISTFEGCTALTDIILPASITEIEVSAFKGCTALQNIYCAATTPPRIAAATFDDVSATATIYVPTASVEAYKAADVWSTYSSKIVGYDF